MRTKYNKEGFTIHHQKLIDCITAVNPDVNLVEFIQDIELADGSLAFPITLRQHSNQRKHSFLRRKNKNLELTVSDFYPFFKECKKINDLLLQSSTMPKSVSKRSTKKQPFEDDDESTIESFDNADGVVDGNLTRAITKLNITPTRKGKRLERPRTFKGMALHQLLLGVANNPFGMEVLLPESKRKLDDGSGWSHRIMLSVKVDHASDINDTTLRVFDADGHSVLVLKKPVISNAKLQDLELRMGMLEIDMNEHNKYTADKEITKPDGTTEVVEVIVEANKAISEDEILAEMVSRHNAYKEEYVKHRESDDKGGFKAKLVEYALMLPLHPKTGEQLIAHSSYWQGVKWNVQGGNDGYLKRNNSEVPSTSTYDGTDIVTTGIYLDFEAPILGDEGEDFDKNIDLTPTRRTRSKKANLAASKSATPMATG